MGTPHHGLPSNKMARITSDCDAMRTHGHQMAVITSECAPFSITAKIDDELGQVRCHSGHQRNQRDD